jgi:hypothetical protein
MNLNQYIKDHVQNILNERLIQKAQSNINNNIDNADKKISSVIRYSSIVENIMSMHITEEQLRTLVCEAFKYFDTLPNVFKDVGSNDYIDHNGYHQWQRINFQKSFESNIKRLITETGPDDPNIRKLLTSYTYCCKWAELDPFDEYSLFWQQLDITTTFDLDYNYLTGVLKPDEFDITKYKCNSKTVIELMWLNNSKTIEELIWLDGKKPIIIDNIFKKLFKEEAFKSVITNEELFKYYTARLKRAR